MGAVGDTGASGKQVLTFSVYKKMEIVVLIGSKNISIFVQNMSRKEKINFALLQDKAVVLSLANDNT